jgi:two-component system phosphate regulon response regulator PhoB
VAKPRILVVEDEADLRDLLAYNLGREGFKVSATASGAEALRLAREQDPDLLLLDLMLPDLDGLEICRRLRRDPLTAAIPIIVLTAKAEESDKVLGLGLGADDYVTKPFAPAELVARVRAVLRRGRSRPEEGPPERVVADGLVIDATRHEVLVDGRPARFTATELRLLHFLAAHAGRVFNRDTLLRRVMGEHVALVDRNVDVHVRAIRSKLGKYRERLETVRGVGYRFRAPGG